ncbi:probable LRR receptor-like serine/threonine-protein kinase At3g47570 [Zea mays]|uniref:probable LRR receptor-like serine/threonine-protein kinase At3g47570 n=1 Tax=Zea mays TaxID=4577 RepID=UPI0009AA444B|nr:probable LRR receptor-like serine/threonine-protein kinase At3g47570 [Zea mays]|eukprot:XP_020407873.1 probable LRR receptor-like serine/threonine-protein kinase At3g47570 [Zea mays]
MEEEMAVKVFDLEMPGAERSFLAECEALRSIQHRNLLPIRTACSAVDNRGGMFKALLYEFMPNGSLDTWLHPRAAPAAGEKAPKRLGFSQRVNIIVNVADVLDYLHHECGRPTVHCDLKPSNILLDDDLNALLGDFGIARFYADSKSAPSPAVDPTSSVGVRGTRQHYEDANCNSPTTTKPPNPTLVGSPPGPSQAAAQTQSLAPRPATSRPHSGPRQRRPPLRALAGSPPGPSGQRAARLLPDYPSRPAPRRPAAPTSPPPAGTWQAPDTTAPGRHGRICCFGVF